MQIQWLATALKIKQHLLEKRETLASLKVSHFLPEEWPLTEEKSSISHPLLDINPQKSNFRLLWWPKVREQNFDTSEISLSLKDLKLFRGPLGITGTFFEFLSEGSSVEPLLVIEMTTFQTNGKEKHGLKRETPTSRCPPTEKIFMALDNPD